MEDIKNTKDMSLVIKDHYDAELLITGSRARLKEGRSIVNYCCYPSKKSSSVPIVTMVIIGSGWVLHIFGSYRYGIMSIEGKEQVGNINFTVKKQLMVFNENED